MINSEVARIFAEIADILEIQEENVFRIRAYRRAAQTLQGLSDDISELIKSGRDIKLPGIGADLASKIKEFMDTGRISAYEKLKKDVHPVVLEMMNIPGVGPKTAKMLYDELGIRSLGELEKKAKQHKIQLLPHLKEKTEENILKGLKFLKKDKGRLFLDIAFMTASQIVGALEKLPEVVRISPAGSLRRMKETVGDIDILVTSKKSGRVMDAFVGLPIVKDVIAKGPTKSAIITNGNVHVDLRVVDPESYGAALMYFTGSKSHNVKLREMAVKKGLKINEYGVFHVRAGRKIAGKTEDEIYDIFGMDYIEPELREDTGEIEAALKGALPRLVTVNDMRGDFHVHTDESDGALTVEAIFKIAKRKKYDYVVITDHSKSLKIAHGLDEKRLRVQAARIRRLGAKMGAPRVLTGSEVDIRDDGSLDYDDDTLKMLDFVIAAVHSGFHQPREKLTYRITKAMQNKYVNLIAHPSGRLIGQREAYQLDYEELFRQASRTGTAIEINAYPERLDLTDTNCRRAKEMGVRLAISTDSHVESQFDNMLYGVSVARRGWLEKKDIVNCLSLNGLKAFVNKKRGL